MDVSFVFAQYISHEMRDNYHKRKFSFYYMQLKRNMHLLV